MNINSLGHDVISIIYKYIHRYKYIRLLRELNITTSKINSYLINYNETYLINCENDPRYDFTNFRDNKIIKCKLTHCKEWTISWLELNSHKCVRCYMLSKINNL